MLVAVDTGATKTLIAGFSEDGVLGEPVRFETPHNQKAYVDLLVSTITEKYALSDIDAIVVALPGRVNHETGHLYEAHHLEWFDFDLAPLLAAHFGDTPILIENDANLAGLAEVRSLDPVPANGLYVTISTGIGSGVITDGHIDPHFAEGEGGEIILEHAGELKTWESFAAGSAIHTRYHKLAQSITDDVTWGAIAEDIARGFLVLIPLLRPDIIVIGGSIGTYFDRYKAHLNHTILEHLGYAPPVVQAQHPEQAVLYGCYYYALDQLAR